MTVDVTTWATFPLLNVRNVRRLVRELLATSM